MNLAPLLVIFVSFPHNPDASLTPGSLCRDPTSYRYPEHIAYCERNVSSATKRAIIAEYDETLGFDIGTQPRTDFKIDHLIPLCMGGSNDSDNLWPQHKDVYLITDRFEGKMCELMARGRMTQAEAVGMITGVKNALENAAALEQELARRH